MNKSQHAYSTAKTPESSGSEKSTKKKSDEVPFCLNTETCVAKRHKILDWKKTSEDKKKEIWDDFKAGWHKKSSIKSISSDDFHEGELMERLDVDSILHGQIHVMIDWVLPVISNGDYGIYHAALSFKHIDALENCNAKLYVQNLEKLKFLRLAVDDSDDSQDFKVTAEHKIRLFVKLSTSEGFLFLNNV